MNWRVIFVAWIGRSIEIEPPGKKIIFRANGKPGGSSDCVPFSETATGLAL